MRQKILVSSSASGVLQFLRLGNIEYSSFVKERPLFCLQEIWAGILANPDIAETTDFFQAGAGSMDVTR